MSWVEEENKLLKVGDIIQINNREGLICYEKLYANNRYICVAFGEEPTIYEIYKYKYEDNKLLVHKLEDSKELGTIMGEFTKEGVKEYGILKSLKQVSDALDKYYEEHNKDDIQ